MNKSFIYLIKIEGKTKIPDYVQLRDAEYTLLAYFRADRPEKALIKVGFESQLDRIMGVINELPFGKMFKYEY